MTTPDKIHNEMFANTSRLIENANKSKSKPKGLISNDTQYRFVYAKVLSLFEKADKLAIQKKTNKLKKVEKEIIELSLEVLDYERFRMNNP